MPNYSCQFSEMIEHLTKEEHEWLKDLLQDPDEMSGTHVDEWGARFWPAPDNAPVPDFWPGFDFRFEEHGLWVYSDDSGNVENVILILNMFLAKFRPTEEYVVSWATTCSRPRIGEFGGGEYVCNEQPETAIKKAKQALKDLVSDEERYKALDDIFIHDLLRYRNQIALIWGVDDVLALAKQRRIKISEEEAGDILFGVNPHASSGINWDTLAVELEDYYAEREEASNVLV